MIPTPRMLTRLKKGSPVFLRAPSGVLSRATVVTALGGQIRTNKRTFDRETGREVRPGPAGPYQLLVPLAGIEDEYEDQVAGAVAFTAPVAVPV